MIQTSTRLRHIVTTATGLPAISETSSYEAQDSQGMTAHDGCALAPVLAAFEGLKSAHRDSWLRSNAYLLAGRYPNKEIFRKNLQESGLSEEEALSAVQNGERLCQNAESICKSFEKLFKGKYGLDVEVFLKMHEALEAFGRHRYILIRTLLDLDSTPAGWAIDLLNGMHSVEDIPEAMRQMIFFGNARHQVQSVLSSFALYTDVSAGEISHVDFVASTPETYIQIPYEILKFLQRDASGYVRKVSPPSLVGLIKGLTPGHEKDFIDGTTAISRDGLSFVLKPKEWGETLNINVNADPDYVAIYEVWAQIMNQGQGEEPFYPGLLADLKGLSFECLNAKEDNEMINSRAYRLLQEMFSFLPEEFLGYKKDFLKGYVLYANRVKSARISAYDNGIVYLYPFVLNFYWHLPAIFIHETGHSTADRVLGRKEGEVVDESIPTEERNRFVQALDHIRPTLERFVVDYVYERDLRLSYIASSSYELIADLHVMYVFNGQAIRDFISNGSDSDAVMAWRTVYSFLRGHVFGGKEFVV